VNTSKPNPEEATPDENLEDLTYEQAIERVESITDRIESGEVGIEEAVREYEKAMGLIRRCRSILDKAEQRISELSVADDEGPVEGGDDDGSA